MSAVGQDENSKELCAVIRFPYGDHGAVRLVIEQLCRSGLCEQPVGVYEVLRYPANRIMGGGSGQPPNAANRVIVTDLSGQCGLDNHTRAETSQSALSIMSADNLSLVASEVPTRVTGGFESGPMPASAAAEDATVWLPSGSRILSKEIIEDMRLPLLYLDVRGRDRPFMALVDTGAQYTVARESIARRGNACVCKLDCPQRLRAAFGQTVFSTEFAFLELRRQGGQHSAQWTKVFLLDDGLVPFVDAYLGRRDAMRLGFTMYWRQAECSDARDDRSGRISAHRL
ncbi:hypothetical protein AYL99_02232 [Fonsecaea erecta]|uniref:Uncharacterized protein n=1 Tax=Fonsecaea erecta TaxID=1367422 RepID=A0A178ZV84_9EURO|nr:hypothetical protein AYL99_02232 [Fonsecaea erecta]OAP63005.1 hypothetical protein AYL99_02232 [Fonsecaea erecta]